MRRPLMIVAGAVLIAIAVLCVTLALLVPRYVRARAARALGERFDSTVQFTGLRVSVFPRIKIAGEGLVLRAKGRPNEPPLIRIGKFSAASSLLDLLRRPHHVEIVRLQGLRITVPSNEAEVPHPSQIGHYFPVVVDQIISTHAALVILPNDESKPPRVFVIRRLILRDAGRGLAMPFTATLMNPVPVGRIEAHGEFGPWPNEHPALTPVKGGYTFADADLATIRGLGGILSSKGSFSGALERINVDGETSTPQFSLSFSHHPVQLETQFHAVVDGTNGNTFLNPVDARIGNSSVVAKGGVFRTTSVKGRTVILTVTAANARLDDLLRLAVKANQPPLSGSGSFDVKMKIRPGAADVTNRLILNGKFAVKTARFAAAGAQNKIDSLSRRGRGKPNDQELNDVASNLEGRFTLQNGVMRFSNLAFRVPGASIHLRGAYNLNDESLDFRGSLRLEAKISQTTTGWKSILLKPLDPLFKKGKAGTSLPIKVTGTESNPSFGVDIGRALTRRSE
ncbi:MAG: AsmA-like C-terminal region-containing protein [Terriglobia bacterium]